MQPHTKDSYREPKRPKGDRICEGCGAVCDAGRWTWYATPRDRRQLECPACKRMRENVPAGELVLHGAYLHAHRGMILELLQRQADMETSEHALERIMEIERSADSVTCARPAHTWSSAWPTRCCMRITAVSRSTIATAGRHAACTGRATMREPVLGRPAVWPMKKPSTTPAC
jgi:hypothetical protein